MAALVCDVCGGKLRMGSGGIATCENCGMEHDKERLQEKVQEISGVVKVDNSHLIENYFGLLENAVDAGNYDEAEKYSNMIIEIEPNNYKAWFIKGKSAGWQSTIKNIRLMEASNSFSVAINNSPLDYKDELIDLVKNEFIDIANAIIKSRSDFFVKYPDDDETTGFIENITNIMSASSNLHSKAQIVVSGYLEPIALAINKSVTDAWVKTIVPEYGIGFLDKHYDHDVLKYGNQGINCITLLDTAIGLSEKDSEADILCCENGIVICEMLLKARSDTGSTLNSVTKNNLRNKIAYYRNNIVESKNLIEKNHIRNKELFWLKNNNEFELINCQINEIGKIIEDYKNSNMEYEYKLLQNRYSEICGIRNSNRKNENDVTESDIEFMNKNDEWTSKIFEIKEKLEKEREQKIIERENIKLQISELKQIIENNSGAMFGEKARIKKEAKDKLFNLEYKLSKIKI